jgi:hypothetical protein
MTGSALFGQPPNTQDDYWIARGMLLAAGSTNVDPNLGAKIPRARPPPDQYRFETKGPGIIAGMHVCIAVMAGITGTHLMYRWLEPLVRFGSDEWFIIPGVVSGSACSPDQSNRLNDSRDRLWPLPGRSFNLKWPSTEEQGNTCMM